MKKEERQELKELMMADESQLTDAQLKRMDELMRKKVRASKQAKEAKFDEYKAMVSDLIDAAFPRLERMSSMLAEHKASVVSDFNAAIQIKTELYDVKEDQASHTFMNKDATKRIKVGFYAKDNYDDTVNEGEKKVKEYLSSLAKDEETATLVNTILRLLSKDKAGNLKASKVLELQQMAEESGDATFLEGVEIIRNAYKPILSKQYVKAEFKNEANEWQSVPLGMTEAGA